MMVPRFPVSRFPPRSVRWSHVLQSRVFSRLDIEAVVSAAAFILHTGCLDGNLRSWAMTGVSGKGELHFYCAIVAADAVTAALSSQSRRAA